MFVQYTFSISLTAFKTKTKESERAKLLLSLVHMRFETFLCGRIAGTFVQLSFRHLGPISTVCWFVLHPPPTSHDVHRSPPPILQMYYMITRTCSFADNLQNSRRKLHQLCELTVSKRLDASVCFVYRGVHYLYGYRNV